MWVNFHFMLIYSLACSTCLFSWYGLLISYGRWCRWYRWCRWWLQSDPVSVSFHGCYSILIVDLLV